MYKRKISQMNYDKRSIKLKYCTERICLKIKEQYVRRYEVCGWKNGPVLESSGCAFMEPGLLNLHYSHGNSELFVVSFGGQTCCNLLASMDTACMWRIAIHAGKSYIWK